jgi:2,3-bisphosphoglycerate-independent phosphoglycerate mutase
MNKKVILLILDGWGEAPPDRYNAIKNANTPNFDKLKTKYPYMFLKADGESVGLMEGQMGTSEVNHLAIGTGRIIWQDLPKLDKMIKDGEFYDNENLVKVIGHVKKNNSKLHITGILSDGGVHSHINHVYAILETCKKHGLLNNVFIHVFTDGRDTAPKSAVKYTQDLENKIKEIGVGEIASLQGRFYLDRDRDWARTEKAFQLIKNAEGKKVNSAQEALADAYTKTDNDQYPEQYVINENAKLSENDGFLCFNFRTDRIFQILKRVIDENILNINITSFINPSAEFKINSIITRAKVVNALAEVLANNNKTQHHGSETEKYAHVTYFFNAEREVEYPGEKWLLHESNKFVKPDYNLEPTMRAFMLTEDILQNIEQEKFDFQIINFPNTDMVGHTGSYEAAVVAAESVDHCLGKIYAAIEKKLDKFAMIVTADHGNSDEMWDYKNNQPHTQHTLNPVPIILVSDINCKLEGEKSLRCIAPTILELIGIDTPKEMEGKSLIKIN